MRDSIWAILIIGIISLFTTIFIAGGLFTPRFSPLNEPIELEDTLIITVETRFFLDGTQWCHITLEGSQSGEWFIQNCEFPSGARIELDRVLLFVGQESDPRVELEPNFNFTFNATNTLLDVVVGPRFNAYVTDKIQRPCCASPPIDILFIAIDKDMKGLQGLVREYHAMIEYLDVDQIVCLEFEEGKIGPNGRLKQRDEFHLINVGVCLD